MDYCPGSQLWDVVSSEVRLPVVRVVDEMMAEINVSLVANVQADNAHSAVTYARAHIKGIRLGEEGYHFSELVRHVGYLPGFQLPDISEITRCQLDWALPVHGPMRVKEPYWEENESDVSNLGSRW